MKMILLFHESIGVAPIYHNLPDEAADKLVTSFRNVGFPAFHANQTTEHKSDDAETCEECQRDIADIIKKAMDMAVHDVITMLNVASGLDDIGKG